MGSGANAALLNTVIIGAVNVGCTVVAILVVDRWALLWAAFRCSDGDMQCVQPFLYLAAIAASNCNSIPIVLQSNQAWGR